MEELIRQGYISARRHPTLPLTIYNYTKQTQYEGYWNDTTKKCRGLVIDDEGDIIVNAPPKFFNKGEPYADRVNLLTALLLEKADGYFVSVTKSSKYGLIVTSRGSFDNKYVDAAKKFITPAIEENLIPDISYFCELLQDFPGDESLIVMRHPDPCLVCWAIRTQLGEELNPSALSPFPYVKCFTYAAAKEYLTEEVEGIVAFSPKTGKRVKIKTEYYLTRHALISNLTRRKIWELLATGQTSVIDELPDDLFVIAVAWKHELLREKQKWEQKVQTDYEQTSELSDKELGLSKDFRDTKALLFLKRKGKTAELEEKLWRLVKPVCGSANASCNNELFAE